MRHSPHFAAPDEATVRSLIAANPWTTIVSHNDGELVASHYPVLIDDTREELTVVTHVGRPDDQLHGFGTSEILMIFQGPHGYISPSWYAEGDSRIATWNFSVAHCYGTPEVLGADENLEVLTKLTAHFEDAVDEPAYLDQAEGKLVSRGTVGIRVPIERFVCKVKMSQNKSPETQQLVIDRLETDGGPYADPVLAGDMRRALGLPPA